MNFSTKILFDFIKKISPFMIYMKELCKARKFFHVLLCASDWKAKLRMAVITGILVMANQSFSGQVSVDGKVIKISGNKVTIESSMADTIPEGSRVDIFFETSEDLSITIGEWKVSSAGNGLVFAVPVDVIGPPQEGMTARILFSGGNKKEQVIRQNHHNAPPISEVENPKDTNMFESITPQLRGKEPKGQLLGIPFPEKKMTKAHELELGTPKNMSKAKKYYRKAADLGHENAKKKLVVQKTDQKKMFEALYVDDLKTVRVQLNKGVNANLKNDVGQTPLHAAQEPGIVKLLILNGADVNMPDTDGRTPMFNKEVELVKILIESGADIHHRSNKGNTPLIWYSYSGYLDGIKYLISLGADVNAVNMDGQTAHDIAGIFAHFKLLEYLESIGAKPGK